MNIKTLKLSLALLLMLPMFSFGQTNDYSMRKCFGYQRDSCSRSNNVYYKMTDESRSALFVKGQTSRVRISIYNGRDYRVSFCHDRVLGEGIIMRIIDAEKFEFTVTQTRDVFVEIEIPGSSALAEAENNSDLIFVRKDTDMGCVGILVEHMITPPKGF